MNLMFPNYKFLSLFFAIIYVFTAILGAVTMTMAEDGTMSDCPFMNVDSICRMNIFEHLATFQNVFRGILPSAFIFLLSMFLILAISPAVQPQSVAQTKPPVFFEINKSNIFFNKIVLALSNGILQPKLYV